jgi:hypothetical protein
MTLEDARRVAAEVRARRRDLVAAVAAGGVGLAELGAHGGADDVKVVVLAEVVPGVGKVRARRVLTALGVPDGARWGELTPERTAAVAAAIDDIRGVDDVRGDGA